MNIHCNYFCGVTDDCAINLVLGIHLEESIALGM